MEKLKKSDKIEIVNQQQKKNTIKFSHNLKPEKGHTLFEISLIDGSIKKADFIKKDADYVQAMNGNIIGKKEVLIKEGFVYISALNKKNALKKFKNQN